MFGETEHCHTKDLFRLLLIRRFFSAVNRGRLKRGFPEWVKVDSWLDPTVTATYPGPETIKMAEIKNTEIPRLDSYEMGASDKF